jgi:hypothetical protein
MTFRGSGLHGQTSHTWTCLGGSPHFRGVQFVRPMPDPEGMSFLLKRWRTWLSPAARQGRKLHRQRVETLQRVVELSRETREA